MHMTETGTETQRYLKTTLSHISTLTAAVFLPYKSSHCYSLMRQSALPSKEFGLRICPPAPEGLMENNFQIRRKCVRCRDIGLEKSLGNQADT